MSKCLFRVAAWSGTLKWVSFLGTLVLLGVGYAAYRAIPVPAGFTHAFGLSVAFIPVAIPFGALFFIVRGYEVDGDVLIVRRLVTVTRIPLAGLERVWADPAVCRGSVRVAGNGGLFSFTGWFYSKRLGRYRMFVTDLRKGVVLKLPGRVVVISPELPLAFIDHLHRLFPAVAIGPAGSET